MFFFEGLTIGAIAPYIFKLAWFIGKTIYCWVQHWLHKEPELPKAITAYADPANLQKILSDRAEKYFERKEIHKLAEELNIVKESLHELIDLQKKSAQLVQDSNKAALEQNACQCSGDTSSSKHSKESYETETSS